MPLYDYQWAADPKFTINDLQKMMDEITEAYEVWAKETEGYFEIPNTQDYPVHEARQDMAYDALGQVEAKLKKIKDLPKDIVKGTVNDIEELIRDIGVSEKDHQYTIQTAIKNSILAIRTGLWVQGNKKAKQGKTYTGSVKGSDYDFGYESWQKEDWQNDLRNAGKKPPALSPIQAGLLHSIYWGDGGTRLDKWGIRKGHLTKVFIKELKDLLDKGILEIDYSGDPAVVSMLKDESVVRIYEMLNNPSWGDLTNTLLSDTDFVYDGQWMLSNLVTDG